jgi:hypothetical protein
VNRAPSSTRRSLHAVLAAALAVLVAVQAALPLVHVLAHALAHAQHEDDDEDPAGPSVADLPSHLDEGHCCVTVTGVQVDAPVATTPLTTAAVVHAPDDLPAKAPLRRPAASARPRAPPLA